MITDRVHCQGPNAVADLRIKGAASGDSLQIWSSSLSSQFLDEVFLYDFAHLSGAQVLDVNGLRPQIFQEVANVPVAGGPSHQPPTFKTETRSYPCTEIDVTNGGGTEAFLVRFVVYSQAQDGGRKVKGYYQWDPSITAV